jgi:hypothetical protein
MSESEGTMRTLRALCGSWRGTGTASYPTIGTYEYREQTRFVEDAERPMLFYEQRAEQRAVGGETFNASHWESGFLTVIGPRMIRMTNAQDSGRLEILDLELTVFETGFRLAGDAVGHFNDPRMVSARRTIHFTGGRLTYDVEMTTTKVPVRTVHLHAELERQRD